MDGSVLMASASLFCSVCLNENAKQPDVVNMGCQIFAAYMYRDRKTWLSMFSNAHHRTEPNGVREGGYRILLEVIVRLHGKSIVYSRIVSNIIAG